MKRFHFLLMAFLLTSCSLVPNYRPPVMPAPGWRGEEPVNEVQLPPNSEITTDMWSQFSSNEMNVLIHEAMRANNDIIAALHRIEQARAAVDIARSSLMPAIDATGSAGRDFTNPRRGRNNAVSAYRAGLQVGYELDLFGRNRANVAAAQSSAMATQYDRDALALIVAADTAQAFIQLLATMDRLQLANNNLSNQQDVLRITQARFDAGTLSALELAQQKAQFANSQASIASLTQQREAFLNQLAVLVGKPPQDFVIQEQSLASLSMPFIAPLQPAELVIRRPDIRASEAALIAANYDMGAARAAFFPRFQLSASSVVGATPASAAATLTHALAASISAPLFSGGALKGALDLAKARRDEVEASYKQAVLVSFQETQDALAALKSADERVRQFADAAAQSDTSYHLARQRFDTGIIDFITLLDTQRSLFSAQDALVTARQDQFLAAIALYKALGGGWKT